MSRYARNVDGNHRTVVDAFRRAGCSVLVLSTSVAGAPDLLAGCAGRSFLVEVKDGSKPPSRRKLRDSQVEFAASWRGSPVHVVKSAEEAFELANLWRLCGHQVATSTGSQKPHQTAGNGAPRDKRKATNGEVAERLCFANCGELGIWPDGGCSTHADFPKPRKARDVRAT